MRTTIDNLTDATLPLTGTERLPLQQSGFTRDCAVDDLPFVGTSGNETVAGIKTFSSSPIVPTPSSDYQAATKKYADDLVSGSSFGIGDIKEISIAPSANGAWVDLDTADQVLSTTNYAAASSLRDVKMTLPSGTSSWSCSISGSSVTFPNTADGLAAVSVIIMSLAGGSTNLTLTVGSTEYVITAAVYSTRVVTVTGTPTSGTQTVYIYPYRTTTSTQIRLVAEAGITESKFTSWTPTLTGFGTATSVDFRWKRSGGLFIAKFCFTAGTVTAVEAQVTLPGGLTSMSDVPTLEFIGMAGNTGGYYEMMVVLNEASKGYITFGRSGSQFPMVKANGNTVGSTGVKMTGEFKLEIAQWIPHAIPNIRMQPLGYNYLPAKRAIYLGAYT